MSKAGRRLVFKRVLSGGIAALFALTTVLGNAPATWATSSPPPPASSPVVGSAASSDSSPTVVRELVASRTADSSTYLLSDNKYRTDIYTSPIHYQDASGAWQDIDPTLVPTDTVGVTHTKASGYDETIASDDVTDTVMSVRHGNWSYGMRLVGGELSSVVPMGTRADFPLAMTDAQLSFDTQRNGTKDTVTLASKAAPNAFTFFMPLNNLTMCTDPMGGYALYEIGTKKRAVSIAPLAVFDSSVPNNSACASATTQVTPVQGGAYITYTVPRSWMDDPARVYPIQVDPSQTWYGSTGVTADTFVAQNYPGSSFGSDQYLYTGWVKNDGNGHPTWHTCRSLVQFYSIGNSIPAGAIITGATLELYETQSTAGTYTTYVYPITGNWSTSNSWSNTFTQAPYTPIAPFNFATSPVSSLSYSGAANTYHDWDVGSIVQRWFDGTQGNNGLLLVDNNDGSSSCPYHQFCSSNNSTPYTGHLPHLSVTWGTVTATLGSQIVYRPGDTVRVGVTAQKPATNDIVHNIQMKVIGKNTQGQDVNRGRFIWTDSDPSAWTWAQIYQADDGTWFVYDPGYGGDSVIPKLDQCSVSDSVNGVRTANFVYAIGSNYGDVQNNHVWALNYEMEGNNFRDTGQVFSILPGNAATSVTTTASAGWWTEGSGPDDANTAGRGSITVTWTPAPSASAYKIYLFNGNTYEQVGTTTGTSWTSAGAVHSPSDTAIAALPSGYSGSCFATGTLDLRDDPRALYAKTAGTSWDNVPAYALKVIPSNSAPTTLAVSDVATVVVNLDSRTAHFNDDAQHATTDLGDIAGQSVQTQLECGALAMSATDLSINSYGPAASLSRSYVSSDADGHDFGGPGWRFSYEQAIVSTTTTSAVYIDERGDAHRFTKVAGTWVSPTGDYDVLTGDAASGWTLAHKDRSVTRFTRADQNQPATTMWMSSESDNNSQTVTYAKNGNVISIAAANGKQITFTQNGSGDASATYAPDGQHSRDVSYHYEASGDGLTATATVTYSYTGTPTTAGYSVDYLYSGDTPATLKLTGVRVNTPKPLANQPTNSAAWDFEYDGARLGTVTAPLYDLTHRAVTAISMSSDFAGLPSFRVTRPGTEVSGAAASPFEAFGVNGNGTIALRTSPRISGVTADTWSYQYSATGEQVAEKNPDGATKSSAFDGRGNLLQERDELGRATSNTYDSLDQLITSADARGSVTTNHYDSNGNVDWTEKLLDKTTGDTARTEYGYDTNGRKSFERKKLSIDSGTAHWLLTSYDYINNPTDDPSTTTKSGQKGSNLASEAIALSASTSVQSISTSVAHDSFGNVTRSTDASGFSVETTCDLAGRVLSSTDASGVVGSITWHVHDALGHETASWQSAVSRSDGSVITANYKESEVDPFARVTRERYYRTKGDVGTKVADRVVDHTFDAVGNETGSTDSFASGNPAQSLHDARGNVLKSWAQGVPDYGDNHATITTFDAENRTLSQSVPGTSTASSTIFNPDGTAASLTAADGSVTRDSYDPATGDRVSETAASGTTTYVYDVAGRLLTQSDGAGSVTLNSYDLADRPRDTTAERIQNGKGSPTVYNALDWVITKTDADLVPTQDIYDVCGRQVSEQVAATATPTVSRYDANGRTLQQVGADGILTNGYDEFGRTSIVAHMDTSGAPVKNMFSVYDSMGRTVASTDTVTNIRRSTTYPTAAGGDMVSCISYGGLATTVTVDAIGLERKRETSVPVSDAIMRSITATDPAGRTTGWWLGSGRLSQSCAFDTGGRLVRQWGSGFTGSGDTTSYTFDIPTGRKTGDCLPLSFGGGIASTYGYTPDGRLASVSSPSESFAYDAAGDVATFTAAVSAANPASGVLVYDDNCRLASMVDQGHTTTLYQYGFDAANGRRISQQRTGVDGAPTTFGYTDTGRLKTFTKPAGALGNPASLTATYTYDAAGQRTGSIVTSGTGGSAVSTTTVFTYDGLTLLSLASTRTVGASATASWSIAYLYSETGRPYAGVYRSGTSTPTVFGMVTTDRGDVVALTDTTGTPFAAYRYDPWGRPLSVSTQGVSGSIATTLAADIVTKQPLRYAGYSWDVESQTYYLSARNYDPATMQFLQKDPAKADGESSAYQYASGDPVLKLDPTGQISGRPLWGDYLYYNVWALPVVTYFGKVSWNASVSWTHNSYRVHINFKPPAVNQLWQGCGVLFYVNHKIGELTSAAHWVGAYGSDGMGFSSSRTYSALAVSRCSTWRSATIAYWAPMSKRIEALTVHAALDLSQTFWHPQGTLRGVDPDAYQYGRQHDALFFGNPYGHRAPIVSSHAPAPTTPMPEAYRSNDAR